MTTKEAGLLETVKNGVVGAVKGTGDIAKATVDTVSSTLSATVKDAGSVGASATEAIGHVAGGAIQGAAAAHGAIKAADKVGSAAVGTVRHALTQTISGVKVVLKAPSKREESKTLSS